MKTHRLKCQAGYMLLLTLIALMGLGGVVIAGFTQEARKQVEHERYLHNKRVLEEAKQALLMYAYNYPLNNPGRGPGRLPCPDTDNDGFPNSSFNCISGSEMVGRFPWNDPDMNFYEARDASGARLWYAVSRNFANNISPVASDVINSNTTGTITIHDQSGSLMYDGALAGIAAVIIAPGARTDRNGTLQVRSPVSNDPTNYLDLFGVLDNSDFINSNSADGFVLGPVLDGLGDVIVNDQMILVTAEDVIAMAEKAVLDTYRDEMNTYLTNTGGIYPWLDSFVTNNLVNEFDADIGTFRGRMPAVFSTYFDVQTVDPYASGTKIRMEPQPGDVIIHTPAAAFTDVSFDSFGDLTTVLNPVNTVRYFWDGHPTQVPTLPMDGIWEMCPVVTGDEEDCNQNTTGTSYIGGTSSDVWLKVYRVTITWNTVASPVEFPRIEHLSSGPSAYIPATGSEQAYVFGNYNVGGSYTVTLDWAYDLDFKDDFNIVASGSLADADIGVVYYPELPVWALSDRWHHSVQVAIAEDYKPDGNNTDCTVTGCLVINNLAGLNNDKISLLAIAGEVDDLVDDGAAGFFDDLTAQFEAENDTSNLTYDRLAGNDSVMVVQ